MIDIYNFFDDPLVFITQQKKLECHREDSMGSKVCPVYVKPIKESFYLSFADNVSMRWDGGRDFTLNTPTRWEDTYNRSKARWAAESNLPAKDTLHYRYHGNRPMGSIGNASGHAGGLTVNFFTGLSVRSAEKGVKCLVTRAFNTFYPSWTMQDGIYDVDQFKGDFSVNFQIMLQGRDIVFQKGEPFASLFFYKEVEASVTIYPYEESEEAWKESFGFYQRKTVEGCPYHRNIETAITT